MAPVGRRKLKQRPIKLVCRKCFVIHRKRLKSRQFSARLYENNKITSNGFTKHLQSNPECDSYYWDESLHYSRVDLYPELLNPTFSSKPSFKPQQFGLTCKPVQSSAVNDLNSRLDMQVMYDSAGVGPMRRKAIDMEGGSDSGSDIGSDTGSDTGSDNYIRGEPRKVTEQQDNCYLVSPAKRSSNTETLEELKQREPQVKPMINSFIMTKIFPELKFTVNKWNARFLVAAVEENPPLSGRKTKMKPTRDFIDHYKGKVSTAFSDLRHSTQTMSRSSYLKDYREQKIPHNFPNNVLSVRQDYEELGESKYTLHTDYRRKNSEEFKYFATRILPCVNARFNKYRTKCHLQKISEVFTASDEAYALALLINEYECYEYTLLQDTEKEEKQKPIKPFTSSRSGSKQGWNTMGVDTFSTILDEVNLRRQEEFSNRLEEEIKTTYYNEKNEGRKVEKKKKKAAAIDEYDWDKLVRGNDTLIQIIGK